MKCATTLLMLLTAAWPCTAATIDFDDLGVGTGGNVLSEEFVSRGYVLSSSEHLHVINDLVPTTSWNGTAWLGIHNDGTEPNRVEMTRQDGGRFALLSLDISEWFAYPNGVEVQITGAHATGTVTRKLMVDDLVQADGPGPLEDFALVPFSAEWQGLKSVSFEAVGGVGARWYALDNIVTADVPEPIGLSLLLTGLGIAAFRRARTRSAGSDRCS